jgi:hypothetical protein
MFSTAQSEDSRYLRCWTGDAAVAIPRYLAREELRVRAAPTPHAVARLAGLLAESEHAPVVVEVWQYRFDAATGKLIAQKRDEARGVP